MLSVLFFIFGVISSVLWQATQGPLEGLRNTGAFILALFMLGIVDAAVPWIVYGIVALIRKLISKRQAQHPHQSTPVAQ